MDRTPLLAHKHDRPVKSSMLMSMRHWLRSSMSQAYLSSPASRRTAWKWSCPLCTLLVVCSNWCCISGASFSWLPVHIEDIVFPFLVIGASRLNIETLLPDFAIVASVMANLAVDIYGQRLGIRGTPFLIMLLGVLGVHSICLGLLVVAFCGFAIADPNSSREDIVKVPCLTVAAWICIAINEFCTVSMHSQLQKQSLAKDRLLDKATEGFCEIDTVSGVVLAASPQMATTLGRAEVVGARLEDLVDAGDMEKVISLYTRDERDELALAPILVTCTHNTGESSFDALMCPYAISDGRLNLFLRVFGEIRGTHDVDAMVVPNSNVGIPFLSNGEALDNQRGPVEAQVQITNLKSLKGSASLLSPSPLPHRRTSEKELPPKAAEEEVSKRVPLLGLDGVAAADESTVQEVGNETLQEVGNEQNETKDHVEGDQNETKDHVEGDQNQDQFFAERQAKYNARKERKRAQRNKVVNAVWGGASYGDMVRKEMEKQAGRIGRSRFRSNNSDSSCASSRASSCSRASSVVSVPMIVAEPAHAVSCRPRGVEPEAELQEHRRRSWARNEAPEAEEHRRRSWARNDEPETEEHQRRTWPS